MPATHYRHGIDPRTLCRIPLTDAPELVADGATCRECREVHEDHPRARWTAADRDKLAPLYRVTIHQET